MPNFDWYLTLEELKDNFHKNVHIKWEELKVLLKESKKNRVKFNKEEKIYA
jgi:hypothetical protein